MVPKFRCPNWVPKGAPESVTKIGAPNFSNLCPKSVPQIFPISAPNLCPKSVPQTNFFQFVPQICAPKQIWGTNLGQKLEKFGAQIWGRNWKNLGHRFGAQIWGPFGRAFGAHIWGANLGQNLRARISNDETSSQLLKKFNSDWNWGYNWAKIFF